MNLFKSNKSEPGAEGAGAEPPVERRKRKRKRVLLSGVVADSKGTNAADCAIRDMNERGAQIYLHKNRPLSSDAIYLLDTRNQVAYLANLVWRDDERVGLSFIRSYALREAISPELEFLRALLLQAKLRQIQALTTRRLSTEEAIKLVGLSADLLPESYPAGADADPGLRYLYTEVKSRVGPDS